MSEYELVHAHIFTNYFVNLTSNIDNADAFMLWGLRDNSDEFILLSKREKKPLYFFEDGFIRSIFTAWANVEPYLKSGISFTVDSKSSYFNSKVETDLEVLLNNYKVSICEKERARKVMSTIINNKVSKYNNQNLTSQIYGSKKNKVLIIDQSYKDASIYYGSANSDSFDSMLNDAIINNPNSDILIKIHPDTIAKKEKTSYFKKFKSNSNIIYIYDEVNPITLFQQVDKVYVCTSQLGFEALICGKKVYTYGLPFYAGWGLTTDKIKCNRRTKIRSIEEVFYIVYIIYSYYVNPKTGNLCEIEDAINFILELRDDFHLKNK